MLYRESEDTYFQEASFEHILRYCNLLYLVDIYCIKQLPRGQLSRIPHFIFPSIQQLSNYPIIQR